MARAGTVVEASSDKESSPGFPLSTQLQISSLQHRSGLAQVLLIIHPQRNMRSANTDLPQPPNLLSGAEIGHEQGKTVKRPEPIAAARRTRWPEGLDRNPVRESTREGVSLTSANKGLHVIGILQQQDASCGRRQAAHVIRHEAESGQIGGRASLSREGAKHRCITRRWREKSGTSCIGPRRDGRPHLGTMG